MKNILLIFIFSFIILGCKKNQSEKRLNETVEYYPNNSKVIYKKTVHLTKFDSIFYFYDDGVLFKKGKQYQENQKIGIWKLYDRDSNLREIREWFTIKGKSRENRVWHLNKKGDTLAWRDEDTIYKQQQFINDSIYFRNTIYDVVHFNKDTVRLDEPVKAYIQVFSKVIRDSPSNARVIIGSQKNNFNYDFSNQEEVKKHIFYDLTKDSINQKWFPNSSLNDIVTFGQWFKTPGKKIIRGFYQQYSFGPFKKSEKEKELDSLIGYKTYFEKVIYVKDSI